MAADKTPKKPSTKDVQDALTQTAEATTTPDPAGTPPPTASQPSAHLRVHAKGERFRRAGITFTRTPVDLPLECLDKHQITALQAEPQLVVEAVEI